MKHFNLLSTLLLSVAMWSQNEEIILSPGSDWHYLDDGSNQQSAWKETAFDYSTWQNDLAPLGYGDPVSTEISYGDDSQNKHVTYYFIKDIEVDIENLPEQINFNIRRDDGIIVYVNGEEVIRDNMPEGDIDFETFSSTTIDGGDETTYYSFSLPKSIFEDGTNRIAVELHNRGLSSSDISFDMSINYQIMEEPGDVIISDSFPLKKGSGWAYNDLGPGNLATNWKDADFDNSSWSAGYAPLGYGDPMETTISYGDDASDKYISYYFTKDLEVNLDEVTDEVEIGLRRDDGAIVYINGQEIIRDNMPEGEITPNTWSSDIVDGAAEKRYMSFFIPKTVFQEGNNRIAIEMHQRDGSSSDLSFDMYIQNKTPDYVCEEGHIACFTSIAPTTQTPILIVPGEHRFQTLFKEGSEYSDGNGTVPGNHDFTAYIPSEGETANSVGWLSVNHENYPGGVSILNLELNDEPTNILWDVQQSRKVDFSTQDLVTTERNCSGGVTPWGTVITAEESTSSGDANNDGYQDVGWLVEIDPVTASVMDYNNDGVKDKLYHLGRMNHENIVVSQDGSVAYYGEDGGTHCVYKFVPDTPNDITSGNVYVLKLDLPLSNDEPSSSTATWVQVPNETPADRNNLNSNASALGGTNFNGVEDVEIGPDGMVYFTAKGKNRVYRFNDNGDDISDFETFVGGMSYSIETAEGTFTEEWADGNDNLAFDDKGNLWVVQDGGRNYIWVVRPGHRQNAPQVLIHSSAPAGAEPTGLTFSPDFKYGFFSIQHPNGDNQPQIDATGQTIRINASTSVVFSNENFLGEQQPTSTPMEELKDKISIFPNPTRDIVNVELNLEAGKDVMVEIFDITGKKVAEKHTLLTFDKEVIQMDLSHLSGNQLLICKISTEGKTYSYKIQKTTN